MIKFISNQLLLVWNRSCSIIKNVRLSKPFWGKRDFLGCNTLVYEQILLLSVGLSAVLQRATLWTVVLFLTWKVLEAREVELAVFFFFFLRSLASSFLVAIAAALSDSSKNKIFCYFKNPPWLRERGAKHSHLFQLFLFIILNWVSSFILNNFKILQY